MEPEVNRLVERHRQEVRRLQAAAAEELQRRLQAADEAAEEQRRHLRDRLLQVPSLPAQNTPMMSKSLYLPSHASKTTL